MKEKTSWSLKDLKRKEQIKAIEGKSANKNNQSITANIKA